MTVAQVIERARRAQERYDRRVSVQLRLVDSKGRPIK